MAKLKLDPIITSIQGHLGDLVFVRRGHNFYVRPRAAQPPLYRSPAQVAHTNQFGVASRWARTLLADPAMRALYQRACHDSLTPHNVAVRDFMHPPVIDGIDLESYHGQPGDPIRIIASDDFKIFHLPVQILTVERAILEQGEAELQPGAAYWLYKSQIQIPPQTTVLIEATAVDLPGNRAVAKAFYYVA